MVKEYPLVSMVGPRILALVLAAAATLALTLSMPVAGGAKERQRFVVNNNSLCRAISFDGNVGEDCGYPTIAHVQPQLEGFEMASDLGSSGSLTHITDPYQALTQFTNMPGKASCNRDKFGRYTSCTTNPKSSLIHCIPTNREC